MKGPHTEPLFITDKLNDSLKLFPEVDGDNSEDETKQEESEPKVNRAEKNRKEQWDKDEESDADSSFSPQTLISEPKREEKVSTVPELELRKLERGQTTSPLSNQSFFRVRCSNPA